MDNTVTNYISEKRRAKRIPVPVGTTALIRNSTGYIDTVHVRDISLAGLLISGDFSGERYPINKPIIDIILNVPSYELRANGRISLLINRGQVVRTFFDQVSKTLCCGIELIIESSYVKENLEALVNKIQIDTVH